MFFTESVIDFFQLFNITIAKEVPEIILPIGISFYTFQTLSYSINIYYGKHKAERHFGIFALYVAYFPQLVAGPIERSDRLLPQLRKVFSFNYERIRNGLLLMMWGFFKKIVIADRLAEYVDVVYKNPETYDGFHNILATVFFSFQIYCDFSGYTDIAIGTALVMGIQLMKNFRQPYLSSGLREFWKRWHISLSTWFRDYVYIPLGGNRVIEWRWYYNIFIVFVVSGLWHGANWTFVIWGALNGIFLILGMIKDKYNFRIPETAINRGIRKTVNIVLTYILVLILWVFFRAENVTDAFIIIKNSFHVNCSQLSDQIFHYRIDFYISIMLILLLFIVDIGEEKFGIKKLLYKIPGIFRWILALIILGSIFILGKFDGEDFIYFQF